MFNTTHNHHCCPIPKPQESGGMGFLWIGAAFILLMVGLTVRGYQTAPSEYTGAPVPIASTMPATGGATGVPSWLIGVAGACAVPWVLFVAYIAKQVAKKPKAKKLKYKKPIALIPEKAASFKDSAWIKQTETHQLA